MIKNNGQDKIFLSPNFNSNTGFPRIQIAIMPSSASFPYIVHSFDTSICEEKFPHIIYTIPEKKGLEYRSFAHSGHHQAHFMLFTDVKIWINASTSHADVMMCSQVEEKHFNAFVGMLRAHTLQTIVDYHKHFLPANHLYRKQDLINMFESRWCESQALSYSQSFLQCEVDLFKIRLRDWKNKDCTLDWTVQQNDITFFEGSCIILLSGFSILPNAIQLNWELYQIKSRIRLENVPWLLDTYQPRHFKSECNTTNQDPQHSPVLLRRNKRSKSI